MANIVQDPTVPTDVPDLSGIKELYLAPSTDVLEAGDLVPSLEGMTYPSRSRSISDVQLDGGGSYKIPSPGETFDAMSLNVYTGQKNVKYRELEASYLAKTLQKYNAFAEDGSGWKGVGYITRIGASSDQGYHYILEFAPNTMERIDAPA